MDLIATVFSLWDLRALSSADGVGAAMSAVLGWIDGAGGGGGGGGVVVGGGEGVGGGRGVLRVIGGRQSVG